MLTIIIGKDYQQGRNWLQDNWELKKLDPQRTRILTNPEAMRGLKEFHVIWLPCWSNGPQAMEIHAQFVILKVKYKGKVTEERIPEARRR